MIDLIKGGFIMNILNTARILFIGTIFSVVSPLILAEENGHLDGVVGGGLILYGMKNVDKERATTNFCRVELEQLKYRVAPDFVALKEAMERSDGAMRIYQELSREYDVLVEEKEKLVVDIRDAENGYTVTRDFMIEVPMKDIPTRLHNNDSYQRKIINMSGSETITYLPQGMKSEDYHGDRAPVDVVVFGENGFPFTDGPEKLLHHVKRERIVREYPLKYNINIEEAKKRLETIDGRISEVLAERRKFFSGKAAYDLAEENYDNARYNARDGENKMNKQSLTLAEGEHKLAKYSAITAVGACLLAYDILDTVNDSSEAKELERKYGSSESGSSGASK